MKVFFGDNFVRLKITDLSFSKYLLPVLSYIVIITSRISLQNHLITKNSKQSFNMKSFGGTILVFFKEIAIIRSKKWELQN